MKLVLGLGLMRIVWRPHQPESGVAIPNLGQKGERSSVGEVFIMR